MKDALFFVEQDELNPNQKPLLPLRIPDRYQHTEDYQNSTDYRFSFHAHPSWKYNEAITKTVSVISAVVYRAIQLLPIR